MEIEISKFIAYELDMWHIKKTMVENVKEKKSQKNSEYEVRECTLTISLKFVCA